jgi:hypothetical protein
VVIFLFLGSPEAQVHVGVHINIGSQPVWGPVGYDYVEYYYFPDIDVFYYVPTQRFVCWEGGKWIFRSSLPVRFHNYDLYTMHKEVINEDRPYLRHEYYMNKFMQYRGKHDQQIIRDSHDSKYFIVRGHSEHNKWIQQRGHNHIKRNNDGIKGNKRENIRQENDKMNRGHGNEKGNKEDGNK